MSGAPLTAVLPPADAKHHVHGPAQCRCRVSPHHGARSYAPPRWARARAHPTRSAIPHARPRRRVTICSSARLSATGLHVLHGTFSAEMAAFRRSQGHQRRADWPRAACGAMALPPCRATPAAASPLTLASGARCARQRPDFLRVQTFRLSTCRHMTPHLCAGAGSGVDISRQDMHAGSWRRRPKMLIYVFSPVMPIRRLLPSSSPP